MPILKTIGEVSFFNEYGDDEEKLRRFVLDKSAIFVRLRYRISEELLSGTDSLKYICSPTTGLNHIIVSDRYKIISLKGEYEFLSTIRATPEHVFGLTVALLRNYKDAFRSREDNGWNRDTYRGYELYHNKIGIIGMGRIGEIWSGYYKAFGSEVLYYDIEDVEEDYGTKCESIEELCNRANIILLEADYRPENIKMIGQHELELLKGKYFVNAARGELVDEDAMIEMIKEDYFAGVALDVVVDETLTENNIKKISELACNHNLILTPHIGGATYTSMARTEMFVEEKLKELISHGIY